MTPAPRRRTLRVHSIVMVALMASVVALGRDVAAQRGPAAPAAPRSAAPIDITGYWESVVVDDFRFRTTPQKGDIVYVPINDEAKRIAGQWDPNRDLATGQQCKAYGAIGVMQQPGRLHLQWDGDSVLKLETDAGTQTRQLRFGAAPAVLPKPSLQGYSAARWITASGGRGRGGMANPPAQPNGELEVVTTNMLPGYLRKNGVPYSAQAEYTEYFHRITGPKGEVYLVVTTSVNDPVYLTQPFLYTYHFKQLPDAAGWAPTPCWNK